MSSININKKLLTKRLNPVQYRVTQKKGTERRFSGKYLKHFTHIGFYACIVCFQKLFNAKTKFESSCGWPAFFDGIGANIAKRLDTSKGKIRTEVVCGNCDSHLGHLFEDGPKKNGLRYCINSASLKYCTAN